ncbi:hypothetical protein BD408DRAFT_435130 [Parasitella parasitica]|nr:hypothetical protein BD408DRAFT_435130 [Parasitella parasitica]
MVEESIDRGELYKKVAVKDSDASGTSTSVEDHSKKCNRKNGSVEMKQEQRVQSFEEIENIYDKGFLSVFFMKGCGADFWINLCLTLLGYLPGHVHAFYVLVKKREEEQLRNQPVYTTTNQGQAYGAIPQ